MYIVSTQLHVWANMDKYIYIYKEVNINEIPWNITSSRGPLPPSASNTVNELNITRIDTKPPLRRKKNKHVV